MSSSSISTINRKIYICGIFILNFFPPQNRYHSVFKMWSRWLISLQMCLLYQLAKSMPGSSNNYKISPKPCTVNSFEGTCMFVWECIKSEGQHIGMCVDSFMFGSCCAHNLSENVVVSQHQIFDYKPNKQQNKNRPTGALASNRPYTRYVLNDNNIKHWFRYFKSFILILQ